MSWIHGQSVYGRVQYSRVTFIHVIKYVSDKVVHIIFLLIINMATKGPPRKKVKRINTITEEESNDVLKQEEDLGTIIAQFKSIDGETTSSPLSLPANVTPEQLELLINRLLNNVNQIS